MDGEQISILIIYLSVALALIWALANAYMVLKIKLYSSSDNYGNEDHFDNEKNNLIDSDKIATIENIGSKIS